VDVYNNNGGTPMNTKISDEIKESEQDIKNLPNKRKRITKSEKGKVAKEPVDKKKTQQETIEDSLLDIVPVYHYTTVNPQDFNFGDFQRKEQQISQWGDGLNASSTPSPFLKERYGKGNDPIKGEINDVDFILIDANKSEKELYEELISKGFKFQEKEKDNTLYEDTNPVYNEPAVISFFNDFQKSNPEVKGVKIINHRVSLTRLAPFYVIYDASSFYGPGSLQKKVIQKDIAETTKKDTYDTSPLHVNAENKYKKLNNTLEAFIDPFLPLDEQLKPDVYTSEVMIEKLITFLDTFKKEIINKPSFNKAAYINLLNDNQEIFTMSQEIRDAINEKVLKTPKKQRPVKVSKMTQNKLNNLIRGCY